MSNLLSGLDSKDFRCSKPRNVVGLPVAIPSVKPSGRIDV